MLNKAYKVLHEAPIFVVNFMNTTLGALTTKFFTVVIN
jgi:ribosomal protein L30E